MKRVLLILSIIGLVSVSCTGTIEKPEEITFTNIPVSSVSLSRSILELVEGESITLTATVSPSNATDKRVSWSSNNSSVAEVDQNGSILAKKVGTAKITASSGGKSASCDVTVVAKTVAVSSLTLDKTELTLVEGETGTLMATILPTNATDQFITWSSSNNAVASVDNNGVVTANKAGSTNIYAKNGSIEAICKVSVINGSLSIHISKVGTLESELAKYDMSKVRVLTISGVLNDIDFLYLRNNTNQLTKLDIKEVAIEEISLLFPNYHSQSPIDITFPKHLKIIKEGQFAGSGVHSVWIGNEVSIVDDLAFAGCSLLENVTFEPGNDDNLLQIKGGSREDKEAHGAFYWCRALQQVVFPIRIYTIGAGAFYGSSLKTVSFDKNARLDSLGGFWNVYPYGVGSGPAARRYGAFGGCGIEELVLPRNVRAIGPGVFCCCGLKRIDLSAAKKLKTIGAGAFYGTMLSEVLIPNTVTNIGEEAFENTSLSRVEFQENSSLEGISFMSFADNENLKSMTIPAKVRRIEQAAFVGNKMETLFFEPNSELQWIGGIKGGGYSGIGLFYGTFKGAFGRTFDGRIHELDFSNCIAIKQVAAWGLFYSSATIMRLGTKTPPQIGNYAMSGCELTILKVPKESVELYKNSPWASYAESISALDE